jgi:hypothetical protein
MKGIGQERSPQIFGWEGSSLKTKKSGNVMLNDQRDINE